MFTCTIWAICSPEQYRDQWGKLKIRDRVKWTVVSYLDSIGIFGQYNHIGYMYTIGIFGQYGQAGSMGNIGQ
jgi:hypothetical protein